MKPLDSIWVPQSMTGYQVKLHADDVRYLLATPERDAAAELLKALEGVLETCAHAEEADCQACSFARAAIAKATGDTNA